MRRLIVVVPLLASCATISPRSPTAPREPEPSPAPVAPASPRSPERARVDERIDALRDHFGRSADWWWRLWIQGPQSGAQPMPDQQLFGKETLDAIDHAAATAASADERRELSLLRQLVLGVYASRASEEAIQIVSKSVATASFDFDKQSRPLRDADRLLASEAHREKRRAIAEALASPLRRIAALVDERDQRLAESLASMGVSDAPAFWAEARGFTLEEIKRMAEATLSESDSAWRQVLDTVVAPRLKLRAGTPLAAWDLPRALRAGELDAIYPEGTLAKEIQETPRQMGLSPLLDDRLSIDTSAAVVKRRTALSLPSSGSGPARLSIYPNAGGVASFEQAYYALGHAVAAALAKDPSPVFSFLVMGERGDVAAALFESLMGCPYYAQSHGLTDEKLQNHVRTMAARRLWRARVEAAETLCDLSRANTTLAKAEPACQAALQRALGLPIAPAASIQHVVEGAPLFASASQLRARLIASQLEARLAKAYLPPPWWSQTGAARTLADYFGTGTRHPLEPASPAEFVSKISSRLGVVKPIAVAAYP